MLRFTIRAALAASLMSAPVLASAQTAAPTVAVSAPESVEGSSQLAGDYSPLIAIGLLVLVIIGAYALSDDDNPSSP